MRKKGRKEERRKRKVENDTPKQERKKS